MIAESSYTPHTAKDILREMKDTSEMMVDLAYSALLFNNREIAEEVLHLEERMDELLHRIRVSCILAGRRVDEAQELSGILSIAGAAENISNAAGDIAKLAMRGYKLPKEIVRTIIKEAEEPLTKVRLNPESPLAGKTLGELKLATETGMTVIAIRRDKEWIFNPEKDTLLLGGDVLFARGLEEGLPVFFELATGRKCDIKQKEFEIPIDDLDRSLDIVIEMKNLMELSVGLAYSAVLFYSEDIANEVKLIEEQMDDMRYSLHYWVLEAAKHVSSFEEMKPLLALLELAHSSEVISDSAFEIADIVLKKQRLHPILSHAIRESEEIITSVMVEEGSPLDGRTLGELKVESETGMFIIAVRRGDKWIYNPRASTRVFSGDLLIARGTRMGEELLMKMCMAEKGE